MTFYLDGQPFAPDYTCETWGVIERRLGFKHIGNRCCGV